MNKIKTEEELLGTYVLVAALDKNEVGDIFKGLVEKGIYKGTASEENILDNGTVWVYISKVGRVDSIPNDIQPPKDATLNGYYDCVTLV